MKSILLGTPMFLLTLVAGLMLLRAERRAEPSAGAPWEADQAEGFYWVQSLEESDPEPTFEAFGSGDEATGYCHISRDQESGAAYFMVPHPCAPVIRTIRLEAHGFRSVAQTPMDTGDFSLQATMGENGVMVVLMRDGGTTSRFALRKATFEEMKKRWGSAAGTDGGEPEVKEGSLGPNESK